MKNNKALDVGYIYYHGGGVGISRDYKEVPTNIKQTIHASSERIDELLENPSLLLKDYPSIVKKLKDSVKMRILSTMEEIENYTNYEG